MKTKKLCLLALSSVLMLAGCVNKTDSSQASSETSSASSSSSSIFGEEYDSITVAKAIEIATAHTEATTERYYIVGTIAEMKDYTYGSFTLQDSTGSIYVYGSYSADGKDRYGAMDEKPQAGDKVVLYATLVNYNGTPEVKSGWIVKFLHEEEEFDESEYAAKTIAQARELASGSKVKVEGVVERITYANGKVANGFYVIDNTSSIYIHSEAAASQVKEGNKIKVCGALDFWILESEQKNAEKLGYKGSCQLSDVTIVSNDKSTTNTYDKSWITETTIKDIMETDPSKNITNKIYKVNSYVRKVPGSGFTNYYFNDIDGTTGSYTYTQCNGGDFTWLDEFDGKICTVYITAINAKSTASGAVWRFVPIEVINENYKFDTTKTNEFVWTYHVKDLFRSDYNGDPVTEVPTSVSSTLLGFSGAKVTYTSSNTNVAEFREEDGKTYFRINEVEGKATLTFKIDYGTNPSLTKTLEVTYTKPNLGETHTVKEAIDAESKQVITVLGIVGPSLVNQDGFYLIDDTGVIAIKTSTDVLSGLSLGNKVALKGTRTRGYGLKSETATASGQSCLLDCELIANLMGKHEYSRSNFITGKKLSDLKGLDATVDHSTEVYTVKAKISKVESQYYTNVNLYSDDCEKFELYTSSGTQYNWLCNAFGVDKEVTLDIAPCNWNGKNFWKGCVLSATDGTTRVDNTFNFGK